MAHLADGDRTAFDGMYRVLWPVISAFCSKTLPLADALDAAQSVLLKVFEQAPCFHRDKDALTWIFAIALWEVRTVRRRYTRSRLIAWTENDAELTETTAEDPVERPDLVADDDPQSFQCSPESLLIEREIIEAALAVLRNLSDADRATLDATLNDQSPTVAGSTFRKRKQRARHRFRQAWLRAYGTWPLSLIKPANDPKSSE